MPPCAGGRAVPWVWGWYRAWHSADGLLEVCTDALRGCRMYLGQPACQPHHRTFTLPRLAVDAATTNGCSPLYIAANNGCAQAAALLLESGADPDLETTSGCTPLHAGGWMGGWAVVRVASLTSRRCG